jgi:hypothetical protein
MQRQHRATNALAKDQRRAAAGTYQVVVDHQGMFDKKFDQILRDSETALVRKTW